VPNFLLSSPWRLDKEYNVPTATENLKGEHLLHKGFRKKFGQNIFTPSKKLPVPTRTTYRNDIRLQLFTFSFLWNIMISFVRVNFSFNISESNELVKKILISSSLKFRHLLNFMIFEV